MGIVLFECYQWAARQLSIIYQEKRNMYSNMWYAIFVLWGRVCNGWRLEKRASNPLDIGYSWHTHHSDNAWCMCSTYILKFWCRPFSVLDCFWDKIRTNSRIHTKELEFDINNDIPLLSQHQNLIPVHNKKHEIFGYAENKHWTGSPHLNEWIRRIHWKTWPMLVKF